MSDIFTFLQSNKKQQHFDGLRHQIHVSCMNKLIMYNHVYAEIGANATVVYLVKVKTSLNLRLRLTTNSVYCQLQIYLVFSLAMRVS